jgi:hypothetical protein
LYHTYFLDAIALAIPLVDVTGGVLLR